MRIVIIGSGVGGISFAEKYRALCADARITLITRENDGYYSRPLLSRGFSTDTIEQSIILKPFDKLILAQGSAAFIPPPFRPYKALFFCLNNLVDLKKLRRFRQGFLDRNRQPAWVIIGGGLIGCEVASDLAVSGDPVTLYHAAGRPMERQLVTEDSVTLLKVLKGSGVQVLLNQAVQGFSRQNYKVCVNTDVSAEFDALIVATGFKPRTELAEQAGQENKPWHPYLF